MSVWEDYVRQPRVTFRTRAPGDAPEVRGYRCYFQPEWLEWSIQPGGIRVGAFGPPTRTSSFPGEMWWNMEGPQGDERPSWLPIPLALLTSASLAVEELERLRNAYDQRDAS